MPGGPLVVPVPEELQPLLKRWASRLHPGLKDVLCRTTVIVCCILLVLSALIHTRAFPLWRPGTHAALETAPFISDVYVISSRPSSETAVNVSSSSGLCDVLAQQGGQLLSRASCSSTDPQQREIAAALASGDQTAQRALIVDLMLRRRVAPATHARPLATWTHGLMRAAALRIGIGGGGDDGRAALAAAPSPLLSLDEQVIGDGRALVVAAAHAAVWQNWTVAMTRDRVPPKERRRRLLMVLQDDAVFIPGALAALQAALPRLDPAFDILGLDPDPSVCAPRRTLRRSLAERLPQPEGAVHASASAAAGAAEPAAASGPLGGPLRLVPVRADLGRTTVTVLSYKGAATLFRELPVTREVGAWLGHLAAKGVLRAYVACPGVVAEAEARPAAGTDSGA